MLYQTWDTPSSRSETPDFSVEPRARLYSTNGERTHRGGAMGECPRVLLSSTALTLVCVLAALTRFPAFAKAPTGH